MDRSKAGDATEPTVFVVDDDAGIRTSLQSLATSAGLGVETYACGRDFLAAYDPARPGCLLLDLRLPDGDGLDVQDELCRRDARLPIIVITAHASLASSVRAFKGGAVDFLQKPVPPRTLLQHIRAALDMDRRARDAAGEANFLAVMSHELRTPLHAILGYQDMLLDGEYGALTDGQTAIIDRVKKNVESLLDLVKATLELSCLQIETIQLTEEIHVDEFIDRTAAEVRSSNQNPDVKVIWRVAPDLPPLRTDPIKLKMALTNLVTNAIKFTEKGTVTIAARRDADGVEFSVSDTGPGIAAETRDKMFKPFQRGEQAWKRCIEGAGLGLYLVRRLLDCIGGRIAVSSEVGVGSCFRVWIPLDGRRPARDAA